MVASDTLSYFCCFLHMNDGLTGGAVKLCGSFVLKNNRYGNTKIGPSSEFFEFMC